MYDQDLESTKVPHSLEAAGERLITWADPAVSVARDEAFGRA